MSYQFAKNINKTGKSGVVKINFSDKDCPMNLVGYCDEAVANELISSNKEVSALRSELSDVEHTLDNIKDDIEDIDEMTTDDIICYLGKRLKGSSFGMMDVEKVKELIKII